VRKSGVMRVLKVLSLLACLVAPQMARAALLPPVYMDYVVAIGGIRHAPAGQPPHDEWATSGTGFLYGYCVHDDPDPAKRVYAVFLVTAKHVVNGHAGDIVVRINSNQANSFPGQFTLASRDAAGHDLWFSPSDPGIDLALYPIPISQLKQMGFASGFFASDANAADSDRMKAIGVSAGDGVFVLGFPMNLGGEQKNYVIVRQGGVARISEMLDHASKTYLVDAFVFPGNSGSPVLLKPDVAAIQGTRSSPTSYLIGVVLSYRPYRDVAVSRQTGEERVMMEENSGLAEVLPTEYIDQAARQWLAAQPAATAPAAPPPEITPPAANPPAALTPPATSGPASPPTSAP